MKKFLLSLLAFVSLGFAASADEVTVTFSEESFSNSATVTKVTAGNVITLTFDGGSNTNVPKYYTTGSAVRMYPDNSFTISAAPGYNITGFTTVCASNTYALSTTEVSSGTYTTSGANGTWTGESNEVTLTSTATSGHARIQKITVTYAKGVEDTRTEVSLSFAESEVSTTIDEKDSFVAPELSCNVAEALSVVTYSSSNENVAIVDATTGAVTILDSGVTIISASISDDDENYFGLPAEYELTVVDPNAIEFIIDKDAFNYTGSYAVKSATDATTAITYTTVYSYQGAMQWNTNASAGKGSGIAVTKINPLYNIKSVTIDFADSGVGVNIYKKESAFAAQSTTAAISTSGAEKVNSDAIKTDEEIFVNAPAFAIIPTDKGVIKVNSVTVTYELLTSEDGSERFTCDAFQNYMICEEETLEIVLPDDAPEVSFTSTNESVAVVEGNVIKGVGPGFATIAATWEAVEGKWKAGSEVFTVNVKYKDLATVLANVTEGQTYVGNFPVTIVSDNGLYNYVTDGTAWALFYVDHKHKDGSILPAGWSGIYTTENGVPEFTNITHDEIEDVAEIVLKEYSDTDITEANVNEVLVLVDVTIAEATPADQSDFTVKYNGKEYTFFNQFKLESKEAGSYNVKAAVDIDPDNGLQLFPIEYTALEATTAVAHVDAELTEGEEIKFTGLEEGAHIY
ncbi:MAG: hypothetical protein K2H98_07340, partial [Duncaniella sp.]|nr:hypothetical protein [Duncaniella sp.]